MSVDPTIGQPGWAPVLNARLDALAAFGIGLTAGVLANRPAANTGVRIYFATDDNGGKLYRSDGSTWTAMSPGVTEFATGAVLAEKKAAPFSTTSLYSTFVDVTGLTGAAATVPASGNLRIVLTGSLINSAAGSGVVYRVLDEASATVLTGAALSPTANAQVAIPEGEIKLTGLTAAATKTYKAQICALTSGTATIGITACGLRVEAA